MSSFFNSTMGKLLTGFAVAQGSEMAGEYFQKNVYKGSFLETAYKDYIKPYNPFGSTKDDEKGGNFVGKVAKGAVKTGAEMLLAEGLGLNPETMKNMPDIDVPDSNVYGSQYKNFSKGNYGGFPQGSTNIIENGFKDPVIQNLAFNYKQANMPRVNSINPTMRVQMGGTSISGLDKGIIRSSEINIA